MAIGSYILQLSKIQSAFSEVLRFGNINVSPVNYIDMRYGTLGRTGSWETIDSGLNDFRWSSLSQSLALVQSDAPAESLVTSEVQDLSSQANQVADSWSSWLADALIPNDDDLKKGFGFNTNKDLATSLKECSLTSNCVEFKEHPLATLSLFGRDLITTGLLFKGVDAVIQSVDLMISNGGDISSAEEDDAKLVGNSSAIRSLFKSLLSSTGVGAGLIAVFHAVAVVSGVASSLATGFITVGVFFGYIVPFLPMMAVLMMGIGWVCEAVLLFLIIPLLLPLAIMSKENGSPLFKVTSIISMYASVLLRGPLIFISFMVFYTLSYGAVYAANSVAFNIIGHGGNDSFFLIQAFEYLLMFGLLGVLYYAAFKTLTDIMVGLPDYVFGHIGVSGIRINVAGTFELAVSAKVLSNTLAGAAESLANGVSKNPAQKKRDSANQQQGREYERRFIRERMTENGYDLDDMIGGGNGGRGDTSVGESGRGNAPVNHGSRSGGDGSENMGGYKPARSNDATAPNVHNNPRQLKEAGSPVDQHRSATRETSEKTHDQTSGREKDNYRSQERPSDTE